MFLASKTTYFEEIYLGSAAQTVILILWVEKGNNSVKKYLHYINILNVIFTKSDQ